MTTDAKPREWQPWEVCDAVQRFQDEPNYPLVSRYDYDAIAAKLAIAVEALEKTPCTGNGDVHILSCYKCAMLAKIGGAE